MAAIQQTLDAESTIHGKTLLDKAMGARSAAPGLVTIIIDSTS
jgi:hypothetical protein